MFILISTLTAITVLMFFSHWLSYSYLKNRIIASRKWCLNICCGNTDGGGRNADIVRHVDVPCFDKIPERLDKELRRVGKNIVYILPPLWDIGAVFNLLEHKWVFLTIRKSHKTLPRHIKLSGSDTVQKYLGQMIRA